MYIYQKRNKKKKLIQSLKVALYKFLTLVGLISLIWISGTLLINYVSEAQWFVPKTVLIEKVEADSEDSTIPYLGGVVSKDTGTYQGIESGGSSEKSSSTRLLEKIEEVFGDEAPIAIAVARAESGLRPEIIGDTHLSKPSVGLFQISQIYHNYPTEQLQNPDENIRIAKEIRDKGGWDRWTTYRTNQYLKFIN